MKMYLGIAVTLTAVAAIIGWLIWPESMFAGYWFGLMFWTQISVGCLIIMLIQELTGGEWGRVAEPVLRAGLMGFFILIPLFIPVLFGLPHLYSWTHIDSTSPDTLIAKQGWLNQPFFIGRTVVYLAVLALLAITWISRSPTIARIRKGFSGQALVATILTMSLAGNDWLMSLQPTFYSSIYPFIYFSDAVLIGFTTLTGAMCLLQLRGSISLKPVLFHNFGKFVFATVFFWGYIQLSQFIIVWEGNLPDEAEWYVLRGEPQWLPLTVFVFIFHFAVPFLILLSQGLKKQPKQLLKVCIGLFAMHFFEQFWLSRPTPDHGLSASLFDLLMPVLIGACWLLFIRTTVGWDPRPIQLTPTPEPTGGAHV